MAQYQGSLADDDSSSSRMNVAKHLSGWTLGVTVFASVMLILLGIFHIIEGIAAIADPAMYQVPERYPLDIGVETWGWLHFTGGVIILFSGFFLMTGDKYARAIAYFVLGLSTLANFASIPYHPAWSTVMIAVNLLAIWALVAYGRYISSDR